MNELLFILLPLAAFTGWWLRGLDVINVNAKKEKEYFKGLSYLLEDETDKAIEIFFKVISTDSSTIENKITLGNLFRYKGEIDRALHIHNSLLKNSKKLPLKIKYKVYLSLADDYLAAGIMNHAEDFYNKAINSGDSDIRSLIRHKLLDLYTKQKRWEEAISVINDEDPFAKTNLQIKAAHFHCEIASSLLLSNETEKANIEFNKALNKDKNCTRASIALARLAKDNKNIIAAINYYSQVKNQNILFLPEILNELGDCYLNLGQVSEWKNELNNYIFKYNNSFIALYIAKFLLKTEGQQKSYDFLVNYLKSNSRIIIIQYFLNTIEKKDNKDFEIIEESINKIMSYALGYRCNRCGFRESKLRWNCSGCKEWGGVVPISDVSIKEETD